MTKGAGRPTKITETLTLEVQNSLRQDACQTVKEKASKNNIGIVTAHKTLTENFKLTCECGLDITAAHRR